MLAVERMRSKIGLGILSRQLISALVFALSALAAFAVARPAAAQIAMAPGVYPRRNGIGQQRAVQCISAPGSTTVGTQCGINAATCFDVGSTRTFSFTYGSLGFSYLGVYASAGAAASTPTSGMPGTPGAPGAPAAGTTGGVCAPYTARSAASGLAKQCFLVALLPYSEVVGREFSIPDASFVSAFEQIDASPSQDPVADPTVVNRSDVCKRGLGGSMDPTSSSVSFLLLNSNDPASQILGGSNNSGDEFSYTMTWDVVGPPAPFGLSVQPADTAVLLNWQGSSGMAGATTIPSPYLLGYQAYAVPMPYLGPIPDAGVDTGSAPDTMIGAIDSTPSAGGDAGDALDAGADASDAAGEVANDTSSSASEASTDAATSDGAPSA